MPPVYRLGSLFSGIGGAELGFEWTGRFKTVFQVEIEPFQRSILAKHWPDVPRFEDVHDVGIKNLPPCDVLVGGFPCQSISPAGARGGISTGKSAIWKEYARVIGELRPRAVVIENSSHIRTRGLDVVLTDLASLGYDAEWHPITAASVGAPHLRERMFVVAYPSQPRLEGVHDAERRIYLQPTEGQTRRQWRPEPPLHRVAYGLPRGLAGERNSRLKALGNAIVPRVAQYVAERLLASGVLDA